MVYMYITFTKQELRININANYWYAHASLPVWVANATSFDNGEGFRTGNVGNTKCPFPGVYPEPDYCNGYEIMFEGEDNLMAFDPYNEFLEKKKKRD